MEGTVETLEETMEDPEQGKFYITLNHSKIILTKHSFIHLE